MEKRDYAAEAKELRRRADEAWAWGKKEKSSYLHKEASELEKLAREEREKAGK